MNRYIKKVAVLGSGVMGSRIACHFANIGVKVLLLDIPFLKQDQHTATIVDKNTIVKTSLETAVKSNPSPVYTSQVVKHIAIGNFDDNLNEIADADWIIEAVVENLQIKKELYEKVELFRKAGSIISSNTSGIPIHLLAEGRSQEFKEHFCGTHFFNPPRYLRLLEIIPTCDTNNELVKFLLHYGDLYLGKSTVLCKDTPAFIANRIGVFSIMAILKIMDKLGLSINEVESLTGTIIGRPKSATFRTADVVGIDTLVKVTNGLAANCPLDEAKEIFEIPLWLQKMVSNNWLGDKTKQGFFKLIRNENSKEILTLDLQGFEYALQEKPRLKTLEAAKLIDNLTDRLPMLLAAADKTGDFYRLFHYHLFSYISHRIPEIADNLYSIDEAIKAGFGWDIGAFETWDAVGVANTTTALTAAGFTVADWVNSFLDKKNTHFYKIENGTRLYYDIVSGEYKPIPGNSSFLIMSHKKEKTVWKNSVCTAYDLGDDVLGLQWNTKSNTIGGEVLEGIQQSIVKAETNFKGLVIANESANFSMGANVALIFMYAAEQDFDELDMAVRIFQQTMMRVRYSSIPVVVAPHGLCLGGACELALHANKVQAAAETYIGLVEMGVGLIPGGGGTKEFALRAADEYTDGEIETEPLKRRFFTIGTAKVSTSAYDAYNLGILRQGMDAISINAARRITDAKNAALQMANQGYTPAIERNDIRVQGRNALGILYAGIHSMFTGNYISAHDVKIAKKMAYVMCGGDLSQPALVTEQYLLDLEREAFLSLCGERKTLERLQSVLKGGKPIRN